MAAIATQVILGRKLADFELRDRKISHFGVKEAVFPFSMFPEVDPLLGPEMRSTGEVLGMADTFGLAFHKAEEAASQFLPREGTVLLTVSRRERPAVLEVARLFNELGFKIKATRHTHAFLQENGIPSEMVLKLHEGRPNIVDGVKNREYDLVINTPSGKLSKHDDSYIRKSAIRYKIPYITTLSAAIAAAKGIAAYRQGKGTVKSLQEYHRDIG
jgi:carbamoyl-phosphate synthase large subunit